MFGKVALHYVYNPVGVVGLITLMHLRSKYFKNIKNYLMQLIDSTVLKTGMQYLFLLKFSSIPPEI